MPPDSDATFILPQARQSDEEEEKERLRERLRAAELRINNLYRENEELNAQVSRLEDRLAHQRRRSQEQNGLIQEALAFSLKGTASNPHLRKQAGARRLLNKELFKGSNVSLAQFAALSALAQAQLINRHFLARCLGLPLLDVPEVPLIRETASSDLEYMGNLAAMTAQICQMAGHLRSARWWGRLFVRSYQLRELRLLTKSAANALNKRQARDTREEPPVWPASTLCFPDDHCKSSMESALAAALQAFCGSAQTIAFPVHKAPALSIIVTVYNKPEFLLWCLQALRKNADVPYEVIIWDDCSRCDMEPLYQRITGARIIRSHSNLNYVLANNAAALEARGEYLLLLNSDAAIRAGALSSSIEMLQRHARIGVAGALLVLPDGTVQEAGNAVWQDGSCNSLGRGLSPDDRRLHSCRIVDYCSGAFFMTRSSLWRQMGGFDPGFAPAYYEETDLCLRLRQHGWLSAYNPQAVVDHYEFATNGKNAAVKLMRRHRERLLAVHGKTLKHHPVPGDWHAYFLGKSGHRRRERWLFVDDEFPSVTSGSGLPRARCILGALADSLEREIWMLATHTGHENPCPSADSAMQWVHRIHFKDAGALVNFLKRQSCNFDVIFISRPHNKKLFDDAADPRHRPPFIIYDAEAIFAEREILRHALIHGRGMTPQEQQTLLADELKLAADVDLITTVSERDAGKFRSCHRGIPALPLHYLARQRVGDARFHERHGLLFVGPILAENTPNADGIRWLLQKAAPLLKQAGSNLTLTLAGKQVSPRMLSCPHLTIRRLGPVPDLYPCFNSARVFVCPVRFAAGVSMKAIDAMAAGLPMVCTPVIAAQLNLVHEQHALVAEHEQDFAACIQRLHEDEALWLKIRREALAYIRQTYSSEVFHAGIQRLLEHVRSFRPKDDQ